MGAFAIVDASEAELVEPLLYMPFEKRSNAVIGSTVERLCDAGFFLPADIMEKDLVDSHLKNERDSYFQLIVMPHENCNFRCKYCYQYFERGRMSDQVVTALKEYARRLIPSLKGLKVTWFGGEPLLASAQIRELSEVFMDECSKRSIWYESSIITNGFLLDDKRFRQMLQNGVRHFQITLDGPPSIHNKQRPLVNGKPSFDRIYRNLLNMRDSSAHFSTTIRVNFGVEHTRDLMAPFITSLKENFGGDERFGINFNIVAPWGGPNDQTMEFCDFDTQVRRGTAFREMAEKSGFPQFNGECLLSHGSVCYAGTASSIVVGSDGAIYKCTVALSDPVNRVGHLSENGEAVIDQAKWDQWIGLEEKNVQKCETCTFNPACQSRSCPLMAIRTKEPQCPITSASYIELLEKTIRKQLGPNASAGTWSILPKEQSGCKPPAVARSRHGRWDFQ
jgi:uncharacterized protein